MAGRHIASEAANEWAEGRDPESVFSRHSGPDLTIGRAIFSAWIEIYQDHADRILSLPSLAERRDYMRRMLRAEHLRSLVEKRVRYLWALRQSSKNAQSEVDPEAASG